MIVLINKLRYTLFLTLSTDLLLVYKKLLNVAENSPVSSSHLIVALSHSERNVTNNGAIGNEKIPINVTFLQKLMNIHCKNIDETLFE